MLRIAERVQCNMCSQWFSRAVYRSAVYCRLSSIQLIMQIILFWFHFIIFLHYTTHTITCTTERIKLWWRCNEEILFCGNSCYRFFYWVIKLLFNAIQRFRNDIFRFFAFINYSNQPSDEWQYKRNAKMLLCFTDFLSIPKLSSKCGKFEF